MCSVRGLYHAFPPPDPPVYVWPQLKPSHGICSFTTTTFGAHRGADQGAGRSTSGWDLHRLLGGSTSASPPSTAGLLQHPVLMSTRPGRHSTSSGRHIFMSRPANFMSRPAYMGLGLTSAFPGPAYSFLGRNIIFPGRNSRSWAGIGEFRPLPTGISRYWADFGLSGRHKASLARAPAFPPRLGHAPASCIPASSPGPRLASPVPACVLAGLYPAWSLAGARPGLVIPAGLARWCLAQGGGRFLSRLGCRGGLGRADLQQAGVARSGQQSRRSAARSPALGVLASFVVPVTALP
jgi:hypothetical protein